MPRRSFGHIRKLPSGRYQASYIGPDGHRHLRPGGTVRNKLTAEAWLAEEERVIERGEWEPPDQRERKTEGSLKPLGEYIEDNISTRLHRPSRAIREISAQNYRTILRNTLDGTALASTPIASITTADVSSWFHSLDPSKSRRNVESYAVIKSALGDAVRDGLIPSNPCTLRYVSRTPPRHQGVALTPEQIAAYLNAIHPRYRMLVEVIIACALRSGEARALRIRDVAEDGSVVTIARAVVELSAGGKKRLIYGPPKTAAGKRSIAVPSSTAESLKTWRKSRLDETGDEDALLFTGTRLGHIPAASLRTAHLQACKKIGLNGVTIHDLRRTGATLAAQAGATVKELMRRLGHTKPDVAMIYQIADEQRDRALADRIELKIHPPSQETP